MMNIDIFTFIYTTEYRTGSSSNDSGVYIPRDPTFQMFGGVAKLAAAKTVQVLEAAE
jgi:hypothetical protein